MLTPGGISLSASIGRSKWGHGGGQEVMEENHRMRESIETAKGVTDGFLPYRKPKRAFFEEK